ncbi:MAG TPA: HAD-IIA family hydrolase [Acidimicrobiia bacterium]|nr:HAD-IIA family hydrolase [Acidimicrobiia bacterium]
MSLSRSAVVCCDLDGVVWRGETPIAGSAEGIARLRAAGLRVGFITNNSSIPIAGYVERLHAFGVPAVPDDVCTSAQAAAALVASKVQPGATVLACAGPGVIEALTERGLRAVDAGVVDGGPVDAVVVGFHRNFDFDRLTIAADAVRGSALFVATNLDPTYPIAGGLVPGTGALVAAVATAAGRAPVVAGKPEQPMADLVRSRFGNDGIMIGDRPSTDGAFARALGWPFALVLSGVAGTDGEEPVPDPPPPFVAADLARLVPSILSTVAGGT